MLLVDYATPAASNSEHLNTPVTHAFPVPAELNHHSEPLVLLVRICGCY